MRGIRSSSSSSRFVTSGTSTDDSSFANTSTATNADDRNSSDGLISELINHVDFTNQANENELNILKDDIILLRSNVNDFKSASETSIQNLATSTNSSLTDLSDRTNQSFTSLASETATSISGLNTQLVDLKDTVRAEKESLLRWVFGIAASAMVLFIAVAGWVFIYFDGKYVELNQKNDSFISDLVKVQSELSDIDENKSDLSSLSKQFRALESRQYSQDWKLKVIEDTNGKIITELSKNSAHN